MADTIEDLVAAFGIELDKDSFDAAREEMDRLANVAMNEVIAKANEMAKAAAHAVEAMAAPGAAIAAAVSAQGELTRNALKAANVIGLELPAALKKTGDAAEETASKFGWLKKGFAALLGLKIGSHLMHTAEHAIEVGANMGDLADKTGLAVEEIQEIGYAGQIFGLSAEYMSSALNKLSINIGKATKGGKEQAKAFREAGIAVKDAEGKARPAGDVMADIADHIKSLDAADRPAKAMELLGKQGKELIPLLKEGSGKLRELGQEARDLGLVMSKETIESMDKVQKNTRRLSKAWEGIKEHAIAALIPEIQKLTDSLLAWYNANKEDIAKVVHDVFHLILIVVKALAKAFMVAVKVGALLAKNWKTLIVIATSLGVAYAILNRKAVMAGLAMFKAGVTAAAGWIIAAAPLIALTALIVGVVLAVQDFMVWMKGGKSLFGEAFGKFEDNDWAKSLVKGFNLVKDSIKWIVDKVAWILEKAVAVYNLITGGVDLLGAQKRMAEADKRGLAGAERESFIATGITRAEMTPQIALPASTDAGAGMPPVTIQNNNNYNITGDIEATKRAIEETSAKERRQFQATVGGAKKK